MKVLKLKHDKSIVLCTMTDVHLASPRHDSEAFKQTMRRIQQNSNYYFYIDGDICENIVPGRKISSNDQTMSNTEQIKMVIDILKPIKHKCLFGIEANHIERTKKVADLDLMATICHALDIPYYGSGGYVKIKVGKNEYTLAVSHGCSGAKNSETELYKLKEIYSDADIFILGHDHKLFATPKVFMSVDKDDNEVAKVKWFCRGGSYLNHAEYAKKRLYSPLPTGSLLIKLSSAERSIKIDELMYLEGKLLKG